MDATKITSLEDMPLVMRVDDLMPILSIGRNAAYNLVRCGKIRSFKIGNQIRIPRDAVLEFIKQAA